MVQHPTPLGLLAHPYTRLQPLEVNAADVRASGRKPGSALVWCMGGDDRGVDGVIKARRGGLALLVVLPPEVDLTSSPSLALEVQQLRPQGILPFHPSPSASDLAQVLRLPPADLAGEVTDYLRWRGLGVDRETVRLLRRILDLSAELKSISAVSRGLYLSRRALGRRLTTRGLPVASHWLQIGRLLRVALRLQNSPATVSSVAYELGYPDAFSLSNQMERLVGHRPTDARRFLGWEWMVEAWLRREAESGRLHLTQAPAGEEIQAVSMARPARSGRRRGQPHHRP